MMKKTTLFAAICCSLLTVGSLQAELPTPILDLPLNEETTVAPAGTEVRGDTASLPEAVLDPEMGYVRKFTRGTGLQTTTNLGVNGSAARTFSYWIKNATETNEGQNWNDNEILESGNGADTNGFMSIKQKGDNNNNMCIGNNIGNVPNGANKIFFRFSEDIGDKWIHVTFTIAEGAKGAEMKCYLNGEYKLTGAVDAAYADYALNTTEGKLTIGRSMIASLSQLKVYDKELSAEEVAAVYESVKPDPANKPLPTPIVDAPLNEASAEPATFPEGFKSVTPYGDGAVPTVAPAYASDADHGNVRTFIGAENTMSTEALHGKLWGTDARTISYWANLIENGGAGHQVMTFEGGPAFIYQGKNKIVINKPTNYNISDPDNVTFENTDVTLADQWIHCVIVVEQGGASDDLKCYINGEKYADGVVSGTPPENLFNTPQWWGGSMVFGKSMTGSASKLKLYKVALTAGQVKKLYDTEKPIPNSIEENKVADRISVQGKSIIVNGTADIQIYDTMGRMTMQRNNVSGQMSIGNLQGIYMIRTSIDGQTATKKVIF